MTSSYPKNVFHKFYTETQGPRHTFELSKIRLKYKHSSYRGSTVYYNFKRTKLQQNYNRTHNTNTNNNNNRILEFLNQAALYNNSFLVFTPPLKY